MFSHVELLRIFKTTCPDGRMPSIHKSRFSENSNVLTLEELLVTRASG